MPAQSRTKQSISGAKSQVRGGKVKGRRAPVKARSDVPVMPIAVGAIFTVMFIVLLIIGIRSNQSASLPMAAGVPCDSLQHSEVHYHVALQILDAQGTLHPIQGGIGIQGSEAAPTCYYWLHVHSANKDVIHIESPAQSKFTLGTFIAVWNAWSTSQGGPQVRLDATHLTTLTLGTGQGMVAYYDLQDGKGPHLWNGDPNSIPLKAHEVITLEITPSVHTPPSFVFPAGL